ncbi:hypothetical protein L1049_025371 [Liquidambar formosana]|uniref:PGG domain-containing protein n=1 Tax=Liquidambar formosana TaxID=63359 RepID=A0AAP0N6U6_LIQFO
MDSGQAPNVELRADTGSLGSQEKGSEITESSSSGKVMKLSEKRSNENRENKEAKEVKENKKELKEQLRGDILFRRFPDLRKQANVGGTEQEANLIILGGPEAKKRFEELTSYLPLYRAAIKGDWESARRILEKKPDLLTAEITVTSETVLQVAVSRDQAAFFVEKLLDLMPNESDVAQATSNGNTALGYAARVGNTKAAMLLVKKNPKLPQIRNSFGSTPLHLAAKYGQKETALYLLSVTSDEAPSPFTGEIGARLLSHLIIADFYGIALAILKRYPKLALERDGDRQSPLDRLADRPLAFASGSHLGYWQRIIYHCIPVEIDDDISQKSKAGGDVENPTDSSQKCSGKSTRHRFLQQITAAFGTLRRKAHVTLWITIKQLVPTINQIHDAKLMHKQTLKLVKCMTAEVASSEENTVAFLRAPFYTATKMGIHEFVVEIINTCPFIIRFPDDNNYTLFQLAVLHRHEKIFSLIHQMTERAQFAADFKDRFKNNLLHLAGKLRPSSRISGAALQMQRELQWFKEVEKCVQPSEKEKKNSFNQTPAMVFTKEHAGLVKQGEEWMKTTATSCTLVASLIATVVFAAAFTVPGGNDSDHGIPFFLNKSSFLVFAIADAIALFSSSTSLLMFLGILTSRYSEEDFFKSLPRKLIIGLITLFISIASMMVAFSASLYIVLVNRLKWVAIPIALLACLPVTLFACLQFPLLVEIFLSTYGRNIFHRKSMDIVA